MNKFIFLLPETIELFGVTFLVNGITLTIAAIPFIALLLIIVYWRLQVSQQDQSQDQLMAQFVVNGWQANSLRSGYVFDQSPGVVTDWNTRESSAENRPFSVEPNQAVSPWSSTADAIDLRRNTNTAGQYGSNGHYSSNGAAPRAEVLDQVSDNFHHPFDASLVEELTMPVKIPSFSDEALAKLVYVDGGLELPKQLTLGAEEGVRFGRQKSLCDHVFDDIRISRLHATIFYKDERFYIQDEGSSGGTFVNRHKLSATDLQMLVDGDTVHFNEVIYRFEMSR